MASEKLIRRYRRWYARLLRLHPKPHHERFGEGMEQTFSDLLRERAGEQRGLFGCALWMFAETSGGIIRENITHTFMQNKNIVRIVVATALILLVPLVAMQFTDEVAWSVSDFVVAAVLLIGTGIMYELAMRKAGHLAHKAAAGIAVAGAFLLIWLNLAVGIIGTEDNDPANLMYFGVIAVGLIGATIARLEPRGMARTLFAMALAQALVAGIALVARLGPTLPLDACFVALWVVSALLFRRAGAGSGGQYRMNSDGIPPG